MSEQSPIEQLKLLRKSIDNIDAALVHILAERFRCTQTVGVLKATHGLPPSDPNREGEQIERVGHADQQTRALGVEVEAAGEVDRHRQAGRQSAGERFGNRYLAAQRPYRQIHADQGSDRPGPGTGRADHGVGGDPAESGRHGGDPAALHFDTGYLGVAQDARPAAAGGGRVAVDDGLRRAVTVVGRVRGGP